MSENMIYKKLNELTEGLTSKIKDNFLLTHFFICALGIIALIKMYCYNFSQPIDLAAYGINTHVLSFFNPFKPTTILQYMITVVILGLYFAGLFFILKRKDIKELQEKFNIHLLLVALAVNIPLIFIKTSNSFSIIVFNIIWIAAFLSPLIPKKKITLKKVENYDTLQKYFYIGLFVFVLIQFFFMFNHHVFQKLRVMNEFWDIPEITILNGKEIDNIKFINENNYIGLHNKFDIRNPNSIDNRNCATIGYNDDIKALIGQQNYVFNAAKNPKEENYIPLSKQAYYYSFGKLCLVGNMSLEDAFYLTNSTDNLTEKKQIAELYKRIKIYNSTLKKNPAHEEFMDANEFEMHWQILNRYWFHHHNHLIGPVNEISLGKDPNQAFFQYGKFNAIFLSKMLKAMDGVSYHNYIKLTFSFYYIYYALFIGLAFVLLKKLRYVLPVALVTVTSLNLITDEFLRIAPGGNPMKHFFDIFVILFFYLYLNKSKKFYLILTFLATLLGILNESNTGLFIFLALLGTLAVKNIVEEHKSKFEIATTAVFALICPAVYLLSHTNADYVVKYFKIGLLGLQTPSIAFSSIFIAICLLYLIIIKQFSLKTKNKFAYVCLMMLIYSQALLTYFIWYSERAHFLVFTPIFILMLISFFKLSVDSRDYLKSKEKIISFVFVVISLSFYLKSLPSYMHSVSKFDKVFKTHKTYEWNLPTAKFISTMNPIYFNDSIDLIKKYSPDNKIYMLSKYDSFLPLVSGKYNGMPYFEVSQFLISNNEIENCIDTIKTDKPRYLYIDKDIKRELHVDSIEPDTYSGYLFTESQWRIQRLDLMKEIYKAIKDDYTPIESTYLLTVYERKNK